MCCGSGGAIDVAAGDAELLKQAALKRSKLPASTRWPWSPAPVPRWPSSSQGPPFANETARRAISSSRQATMSSAISVFRRLVVCAIIITDFYADAGPALSLCVGSASIRRAPCSSSASGCGAGRRATRVAGVLASINRARAALFSNGRGHPHAGVQFVPAICFTACQTRARDARWQRVQACRPRQISKQSPILTAHQTLPEKTARTGAGSRRFGQSSWTTVRDPRLPVGPGR
jgi:hypothetical protein